MRISFRALLFCLALCSPCLAAAQPQVAADDSFTVDGRVVPVAPAVRSRNDKGITIRATRITSPLMIDGRLDKGVYGEVQPITEFEQQEPHEGAPVSERTEAWILFDDKNLYVSCRCFDSHPERMVANDMRRDSSNLRQNDNFGVLIDTFHDKRNGFLFYLTPVGGMFDGATSDERTNNADWNTVWDAKSTRSPDGWYAEIAIPFKSLRYRAGRDQVWGLNIRRTICAKNEYAYLTPMKPSWGIIALFRSSAAATLVGIEAPPAAKNIEVKPYAISRLTTDNVARPAVRNDFDPDVGLDVKYGLTKSLTADLTINTDFAQVEADEVQVNLTRFNLQFPEKRDFFLEGQGVFTFGNAGTGNLPTAGASQASGGGDAPTIFYSRQIGLTSGRPVPIDAGGRLSGRVGKFSVGALNINTDADGTTEATNFTVLRVRRDIWRRSTIGALFTNRSESYLGPGSNQVAGIDGNFGFFQNIYFNGYVAKSRTDGVGSDELSYRGNFSYAADRYGLQLDRTVVGDDFNPEVGFLRRSDFRRNFVSGRFSPRPAATSKVRRYFVESSLNYVTDNDNALESRSAMAAVRAELQNSDAFHLEYFRDFELLRRPFAPASGISIPVGGYTFQHVRAAWAPGQQHRLSGTAAIDVGEFYDGTKQTFAMNARYGISRQLGVEPNISLNWITRNGVTRTVRATGARTTFTMTPRMFVAALVQYVSTGNSLTTNFRFRWEYQPGSELFVVYTDGHDVLAPNGIPSLQNRGLVVKVNRLFRF
ncbi:MAG TPA: DUF5916 domain-containing protein [Vicinamibacterales bacterium]|nr:DUF5916 domain-containing protein [Vicinamibacterales bacterium]